MNESPRVSLGLPVLNGARYLDTAIRSMAQQTYSNFELIISDNGSTDRTEEIGRRWAEADDRIRYVRHEVNRGAAWNYNFAFRASNGTWFKWAAHDDVLRPRYLEKCLAEVERHPEVVLCYPRTRIIDADGHYLTDYDDDLDLMQPSAADRFLPFLDRHLGSGAECNAVFGLIRRDVLASTSLIGAYPSSDAILLAEIVLRGRVCEIDDRLFLRRDHEGTSLRRHAPHQDRAVWFDPENRGRLTLPRFRWWREYHRAIVDAPLSRSSRIQLLGHLHRRFLRYRGHHLVKDLVVATRRLGRRVRERGALALLAL